MLYNTLNNKSNGAVFLAIDEITDKEHTLSVFCGIWYNKKLIFIIPYSGCEKVVRWLNLNTFEKAERTEIKREKMK